MSFWRLYYHLVWATKNRAPLITPLVEPRLYGCLRSRAVEMGVNVYAVRGYLNHVHLVVSVPPPLALADVVKRLKGASAFELNESEDTAGQFIWQRGYGALSLGERQKPAAIAYVHAQEEHHTRGTANDWLERATDLDDAPGDAAGSQMAAVREDPGVYLNNLPEDWP